MPNQYLGVDPMLSKVAIAFKNVDYIAEKIWLPLDVKKQSAKHFIYDKRNLRQSETLRAAGSNSNEIDIKLTPGTPYFADDHVLKQFVSDEDRDNAIQPVDPLIDATENCREGLLIDKEIALAATLADTAVLTNNDTLSGTDQWSDFSNSDPFDDIQTGKTSILQNTGRHANTLVLGQETYDKLKHHPDLLERVKYSQKGILTTDLLKALFGVKNVLIGSGIKNTATEGQTDTTGFIWGKHAWLAYVHPKVERKMVTFGYHYRFKKMVVEKLRGSDEEDRKGTFVRCGNDFYDQKIVAADAGYLIKDAIE